MRIVLYYSEVESFNFFTDQLSRQLKARGHEAFILDLANPPASSPHSYVSFARFASQKVDAVICFDGLGIREDSFIELWNSYQAAVIDIILDPPLRFHPTLINHPRNYLALCCDRDHVSYIQTYFGQTAPHAAFMPHAGVLPEENAAVIPFGARKYDILFSGTYYHWESMLNNLKELFPDNKEISHFYEVMFRNLTENCHLTTEQAVLYTLRQLGWDVSSETLKTLLRCSESVDWAVRHYYREKVVTVLAEAGFEFYLLGRGWENLSCVRRSNVHHLKDRVAFKETLPFMADAKINLNVFPWFKSGTHERIFNALLQHSVPLTDSSRWVDENFTDGVDIALYDLEHLDKLPGIAEHLLTDQSFSERLIQKGYEKAAQNFTWSHCTDQILAAIAHMAFG
ncbi:glycosyltransferase [Candidatus Merdisoma sp. JLR.KK006]|uniref:glycosyltransferase n=1 Tax=Candidatus Merdisoma sp. JLR.KK006 TaxID=3112626 RepID=UPI002FF1257A